MEVQIIDNSGAIVARYPSAGIISFDGGISYFCTGNGDPTTLGITFPGGAPGSFISCVVNGGGTLWLTPDGGNTWNMIV